MNNNGPEFTFSVFEVIYMPELVMLMLIQSSVLCEIIDSFVFGSFERFLLFLAREHSC